MLFAQPALLGSLAISVYPLPPGFQAEIRSPLDLSGSEEKIWSFLLQKRQKSKGNCVWS